jgi:hypothetical protein
VILVAQAKAEAIRLVNEAAERYFVGNAQSLKRLEMVENALRDNAKIVITEHGISPTLLLGSLPMTVAAEGNGHKADRQVSAVDPRRGS